jgi:hypothetical protein
MTLTCRINERLSFIRHRIGTGTEKKEYLAGYPATHNNYLLWLSLLILYR